MPGKAKPGKQRTHSGAKKRVRKTGSGKLHVEKAAHNHRLNPKNKRQRRAASKPIEMLSKTAKNLKRMLSN